MATDREFLRHTLATLAYRGAWTTRGAVRRQEAMVRQTSIAIMILVALAGCAKSETQKTASTPAHVDPILNARAQSLLGISLPCTLIAAIPYMGGASAGGTLGGSRGEVLKFAFGPAPADSVIPPDTLFVAATGKLMVEVDSLGPAKKQYLAYIGADYPTRAGARPLAINSPAESVFIDVLRTAVLRERGAAGAHQDAAAATVAGVITVLDRQRSHAQPGTVGTAP